MLRMIIACDAGYGIGYKNRLPWNLPEEMEYFKSKTLNSTVVMGRKTFESIGKPLVDRKNVIMTRTPSDVPEGTVTVSTVDEVLKMAESGAVWIIGGAEIIRMFLPHAEELYLTKINHTYKADVSIDGLVGLFTLNNPRWRLWGSTESVRSTPTFTKYIFKKINF